MAQGNTVAPKELVDAFEEKYSEKNAGKEIGTGRGSSGGDDADSWASTRPPAAALQRMPVAPIYFFCNQL